MGYDISAAIEFEWAALRERIISGCLLDPSDASDRDTLLTRVKEFFGDVLEPPPLLILSKDHFAAYVRRHVPRRSRDPVRSVKEAAGELWGELDETLSSDSDGARQLTRLGLKRSLLGVHWFFEYETAES